MGISDRGSKAKTITSCDNAFVTNIVLAQAAHRTPPGSFAKAKRQQLFCLCESVATATMFYLCESEATATMFYLCESEAAATTKRPVGTEINHTFW
ncbi:hypothetical protein [Lysinibacillus sp. FJAT-14222]|uniref:hypothetical protein n=1 Tax=Lysinibacillus sp. FJAT-14222 TaxID=1932366 RepID=UPI0006AE930F|nr:hypothetical protein [Lysinibacillus sp. FJAT-14222]KOS64353.1 hypothetical protein AN161_02895 [Lysinibacillus sp. FJAT-14222]